MFWIFRKRFDFYALFAEQAGKSRETLQALVEFLDEPVEDKGKIVKFREKEADAKRRQLVSALNASFITPIDREDIFNLSRTLDDMADYAKSTVEEMGLFGVAPDQYLREMAQAMEEGARLLQDAAKLLPRVPKQSAAITEHLVRVKKLENYIEKLYRRGLKDLFEKSDVVGILKSREIYRHLSNAADRMDNAADILGDIVVKFS